MKELPVYNLQFPDYVTELNIVGYKFKRVSNYEKAFAGLQHIIDSTGGEFPIIPSTGTHQQTAIVEVLEKEEPAILPWVKPWIKEADFTKLQDILVFLSLFTGRNVLP